MPNITACSSCISLVKQRSRIVNGRGNPDAKILLLGQNPGKYEDQEGKAFVGKAGGVLASLLEGADIKPTAVWLINAVRCWSPGNRKPKKEEILACRQYLIDEISEINPEIIVALGAVAVEALYQRIPLDAVMGRTLTQEETGIPFIPTYHPAFVMRSWNAAPLVISHLQKAKDFGIRPPTSAPSYIYHTIISVPALRSLRDYLLSCESFSVDSETTGKDWKTDELLCVSFSPQQGEGYTVPILGQGTETLPFWAGHYPEVVEIVREILSCSVPKALQNAAFDMRIFERHPSWGCVEAVTSFGWKLENLKHDTLMYHRAVAEYMPKESKPGELGNLTSFYLDWPDYEAEIRKQSKNKTRMDQAENNAVWWYGACDTDAVSHLVPPLRKQVEEEGMAWVMDNVTMPMLRACQEMTRRGMLVDREFFDSLCTYYDGKLVELREYLFSYAGEFNPNTPVEVQRIMHRELGLPKTGRKTDKAVECDACKANACNIHDSTDKDTLKELFQQTEHPFVGSMIEYRSLTKRKGTYLAGSDGKSGLYRHICEDNRIHSSFKVGAADTGRISSADPNVENLPKDVAIKEWDEKNVFRRIFVAPPGKVIMEADWSTLEVWVLAYKTGDETLLGLLEAGQDIHTYVARRIWPGIDDHLDDEEWRRAHEDIRDDAKVFTFGISYGLTIEGIMERLHCAKEVAEALLAAYLVIFPGLPGYFDEVRATIMRGDDLFNIFDRRYHFPQVPTILSLGRRDSYWAIEEIFRKAVNRPIQGGGGDLHNLAHVTTENHPKLRERFAIIDAVHDSCVGEADAPDPDYVLETAWMIKDLWERIAQETILPNGKQLGWNVPVEVTWGPSWGTKTHVLTAKGELLKV